LFSSNGNYAYTVIPCIDAELAVQTRKKSSVYALKRFKDENPYIERSFKREYSVLQELVKIPHDHILLHLGAWSQGGIFYMIFPQARCNLRTFMEEAECPGLAAKNVVWFFKQLRGLADAVRHIHTLEPLPALCQFRGKGSVAETDQSACHNDIKPENILVFDSGDSSLGVLKISDFGCGRVSTKDCNSETQPTERFYGTPEYESPDLVIYKEASKPNDIWALGCVFLELLDWFTIPRTEKKMSFQSQRYTGPGPTNPAFWYRNPENKFQLKPQVGQKLMELEKGYCLERLGFEHLLNIIWYLLDVEMKDRCTAEQVYNDLNYLTRQAIVDLGQDPDYYLRPRNVHRTIPLLIRAFPKPSWGLTIDEDDWNPEDGGYVAYSEYCDWNTNHVQITDIEGHEHFLGNKDGNRLVIAPIPVPVEAPRIRKRKFWDKYAHVLNKTF
jgi:serine/threonine protein kinase